MSTRRLLATVACLLCLGTWASADELGNASAHVYLNINPNISMGAISSIVDGGTLQTGSATIEIVFRIDANTEAVIMSGFVSPLFKGNDPAGTEVPPLAVDLNAGLKIDPETATEVQGGDGTATYIGAAASPWSAPEGDFPGFSTEELVFESSQDGHFSQDVVVTATWLNDDPEKPQGEYSGYVVLFGGVVP
jgi:hypothetical protein